MQQHLILDTFKNFGLSLCVFFFNLFLLIVLIFVFVFIHYCQYKTQVFLVLKGAILVFFQHTVECLVRLQLSMFS